MKTAATNKKIRELIGLVRESRLVPRPEFQRRLVWTNKDKDRFLDTVLKGLPFPEIYVADGDVDLITGQGTQLLVDGLQRVSTLIQYFEADPDLRLLTVPPYQNLQDDEKRNFLQYDVAVRDLGVATRDLIVEVFQRINATKYALTDIEINNAVYSGALKQFAARFAESEFFTAHQVFNSTDFKRMGDLRFALTIICTLIRGYFNRDEAFEGLLARYNDDFPLADDIDRRLLAVVQFVDECGFGSTSRVWKKADLFTLLVEIDRRQELLATRLGVSPGLDPRIVVETLERFYFLVDSATADEPALTGVYYKAALQATNDRLNRVRRGVIIGGLLEGLETEAIQEALIKDNLVPDMWSSPDSGAGSSPE